MPTCRARRPSGGCAFDTRQFGQHTQRVYSNASLHANVQTTARICPNFRHTAEMRALLESMDARANPTVLKGLEGFEHVNLVQLWGLLKKCASTAVRRLACTFFGTLGSLRDFYCLFCSRVPTFLSCGSCPKSALYHKLHGLLLATVRPRH